MQFRLHPNHAIIVAIGNCDGAISIAIIATPHTLHRRRRRRRIISLDSKRKLIINIYRPDKLVHRTE